MTTGTILMDKWNNIPWKAAEKNVFKLQNRIYRASQRNDIKTVHKLQRLLIKSQSAKCLAVRRVTQDNQGKKTAGVDGKKSLTPQQRIAEVKGLKLDGQAAPVRRIWIPKPGKNELRGLGIPTIHDRTLQTLVKFVLEPEWEARFEPNSYGFRPARATWDAIAAIYNGVILKPKWVLDTDIEKCYDRINHSALLKKINTFPQIRRQIRAWLKAGVMDEGKLFPTEEGVPQGGTLSCLLANIALHGIENDIRKLDLPNTKKKNLPLIVRYADDLVVMHSDLEVIEKSQELLMKWLSPMGLQLKPSKTRITHTLNKLNGESGFNFLGFTIRQYPVGKTKTGYNTNGKPLGYKTLITPSKEAFKKHVIKLGAIVEKHQNGNQEEMIYQLNPVIRGWTNYYSTVCSNKTFSKLDDVLYHQFRAWALRRHPHKKVSWVVRKYWKFEKGKRWVFEPKNSDARLFYHQKTPIKRHIKIQGQRSPFDGDWVYWSKRLGQYPGIRKRVAILLKRQQGKCLWCGLFFHSGDLLEVDHIIPRKLGGMDAYINWQLLHKHCHDSKTAEDIADK